MGLIMAVALLAIAGLSVGMLAPMAYQVIAADNTFKTAEDLESLKVALAGNPRLVIGGGRSDFGFIGTMGSVPAAISALWLKGAQATYNFDTTKKVGAGWVGPYVPSTFVNDLLAMDKDRFGNSLIVTSTPFVRPSDGQTVAIRIQSPGADATAGTTDDQQVDILKAEIFSTVTGLLRRGNNPAKFATVTLNIPSNGALTQRTDVTDSNGIFEFTDVSFGFRSVSVDPKLTYSDGTAKVSGNDTFEFKVANYGTNAVSITSISATYGFTGWFETVKVGNTTVFDYTWTPNNGNRGASGQTITFRNSSGTPISVNVSGSGKPTQVVPIRVEREVTVTPDVLIKGVGNSVTIRLEEFRNAQSGSASAVSIASGTTFTIGFSDGSQNVITVP